MSQDRTWLVFAGRGRDLTVCLAENLDAQAILKSISIFLPGWPVREAVPEGREDISITGTDTDFLVRAESWAGGESPAGDPNNAANALAGLLIDAVLAHGMAHCCLHAAAAEIGGRAVLFAGPAEAGKSTLALRLAARGCRHLSDDRILLLSAQPPYRVAPLGLAAKAREPLPPGADLATLVGLRWHMRDETISYLHLAADECAGFGAELPLGAIVLPQRNPSGTGAELQSAQPGELARTLIEETTSPAGPAAIVPAMTRLAGTVDGYILSYGDGAAAADRLLAQLSDRNQASQGSCA